MHNNTFQVTVSGSAGSFTRGQSRWLYVAILGIAFALYLFRLDYKPLWWDEGGSIYFARLPILDLLQATAADVHPPVYLLLLKAWAGLVGWAPTPVRLLSVLLSVLSVAAVYALSRRLLPNQPRGIALIAPLVTVALPLSLYRAQEARMYALEQFLVLLSWYALLRIVTSKNKARFGRWAIFYPVITVMMLYTHYTAAFVLGAQIVFVVLVKRDWKEAVYVWALQAVASIGFLFWIIPFLAALAHSATQHFAPSGSQVSFLAFLGRYLRYATVGFTGYTTPVVELAIIVLGALVLAGMLLALWRRMARDWLLLTWIIIPALCMWISSLWYRYEGELTRPLLALNSPALVLAACWLLLHASKVMARGAMIMVLASMSVSVLPAWGYFYNTIFDPKEDYRPLIDQMKTLAQPNDAVLAAYPWQDAYFASYAPDLPLTIYRNAYTPENATVLVGGIFDVHDRLWVVNYFADIHYASDPLNAWLHHNAALAFEAQHGNSQLALFVRQGQPQDIWPKRSELRHQITLEYDPFAVVVPQGGSIAWDMRWQTAETQAQPYRVFVHLRVPDGLPLTQDDRDPVDGQLPVPAWQLDQPVLDRRALLVPPQAPPGDYFVYVGLYDPQTGQRVQLLQPSGCDVSDGICVGEVEITRR